MEAAMDMAANLETLDDRDILSNPSTSRRQTPGRERNATPFKATLRKLEFGAVNVPTSLSEAQKELWKEGRCIYCKEKFKPRHKKVCKRQLRVNEMEVEGDVEFNKEIGEYGSYHPNVS